jgi:hypothetical protein
MGRKVLVVLLAASVLLISTIVIRIFEVGSNIIEVQPETGQQESTAQISSTSADQTVGTVQSESSSDLQITSICRGILHPSDVERCQNQFFHDDGRLGLGEPVFITLSSSADYQLYNYQFDDESEIVSGADVDLKIAGFRPESKHSIRVLSGRGTWSEPVYFGVDLLPPGSVLIYSLCVNSICAPDSEFIRPEKSENTQYPFVEFVHGVSGGAKSDFEWLKQQYIWIEVMLDDEDDRLGCLNCRVGEFNGFDYPARVEFGASGIFYNWDLANLEPGLHELRVRSRNNKYEGEWSPPLQFVVK